MSDCNTFHEAIVALLRYKPFILLVLLFGLIRGPATLEDKGINYELLEVTSLPYNRRLIDWLKEERGSDKRIVLSYTTDKRVA